MPLAILLLTSHLHAAEPSARWIGELGAMAKSPSADAQAFTRRADNLLGLVRAHFESEEDVLLPVLDRTMTPEQFRRRS